MVWKNGAWIEPCPPFNQKIQVTQTSACNTEFRLNDEKLRVQGYEITHYARDLPQILIKLSGMTQLDITEIEGEFYLEYKGMRFKRIE